MSESFPPSAPIIIAAPTQRCGTTLIQRAINSTGQAIVFGENFVLCEQLPALVARTYKNRERKARLTAEALARFTSGRYDEDMSSLYPNHPRYAELIRENFERVAKFYDDESRRYGFSRWGIKNQVKDLNGFAKFSSFMPHAKFVFLYRDILDVVKSQKARFPKSLPDLAAVAAYTRRWADNSRALMSTKSERYLHIDHRDLVSDPESWAGKLEAHFHVENIDRSVFLRKVNVSPITDKLSGDEINTHYRSPEPLTDEEIRTIKEIGGETARLLGYEWAS